MGSFRNSARRQLMALSEEMQRLLDEFLACRHPLNVMLQPVWRPPTDVFETDTHVVIKMDIAGMNERDIEVTFCPQTLILRISGKRSDGHAGRKLACQQMEIIYGNFMREIELPENIDPQGITRGYRNGFLEILVPKRREIPTRKITIKIQTSESSISESEES